MSDERSTNGVTILGGVSPLAGSLPDLNDSFSFVGSTSGTANVVDIAESLLFSNLQLELENNSASATLQISLLAKYELGVNTSGLDATAVAGLQLFDLNTPADYLLDESISSDTLLSPGLHTTGLLSQIFHITLAPLASTTLAGTFGIDGIAFDVGDSFTVTHTIEIILADVIVLPFNVPEPNVMTLLLMSLFGLYLFSWLSLRHQTNLENRPKNADFKRML